MYHTVIQRKILEQAIPHSIMLELTYRCNLDCFFCYNDLSAQGQPLSLEQYVKLFDDLARMQVMFVTLTGGEALLHPEFFKIGRAARERGFVIRVKSGGHAIAGKIARRIKTEVNPYQVEISLHGATAQSHDRQTRVPGSFDRLMKNIPDMQSLELRPCFVSTLTLWNEHEVDDMFELAERLGVVLRFQGPVVPKDDGDQGPLSIQPSAEGWRQFKIAAKKASESRLEPHSVSWNSPIQAKPADTESELHCGIGSDGFLVDPYGNVYPCLRVRRTAGNLHETDIETIWTGSKVFPEARELSRDAALRIKVEGSLSTLGAPVFCPGLELKGCATSCGGCGS